MSETQPESKTPRRRFFKRAALATLIAGVAAGIGWKAFAQGGGYGGWHRGGFGAAMHDPVLLDRHLDRMLQHAYIELEATEEQKQKLAPIVKDAVKDLLPAREKLHAARSRAVELLAQERVDRAALEALRAEQLQLAEQASRRLTKAFADAAEVLTPEQRRQIAEHMAQRRRGWHRG